MYQNQIIHVINRFKHDVSCIVRSEALRGHSNTSVHSALRTSGTDWSPWSLRASNLTMHDTSCFNHLPCSLKSYPGHMWYVCSPLQELAVSNLLDATMLAGICEAWLLDWVNSFSDNSRKPQFGSFWVTNGPKLSQCGPKWNHFWRLTK